MRLGLGIGLQYGKRASSGVGAAAPDFRILVNTANAGVSNSDQFNFTGALGDYDVEVYDQTGTTLLETITGLSDAATITIAAGAGTYELRVFPAASNGFNRIQFSDGGDKLKLLEIRNWGEVVWSDFTLAFRGCGNLTNVYSQVIANNQNVTSLVNFFRQTPSMISLDLTTFPVDNVTNCILAFDQVAGTVNLTGWQTANVESFNAFANNAGNLVDIIGIEDFDISNVIDFTNFLRNATLPTSRYDALLINYEAQAPNPNLSFSGGNSKYTAGGAAEAARTSLINTYNWIVTDGGPA